MLWAAICLAFFGFLHISEFTTSQHFHPAYNLCSGDVTFVPSIISPTAVRIGLKCSTTDPCRKGVCLTLGQTGSHTCAVKALHAYVVSCRPLLGPLSQFQDGKPICRDIFTKEIRNLLKRGGYEPKEYAGHSFRIGAATTAAAKNLSAMANQNFGKVVYVEIEDIEVGVPQGSCLGPLLFLVYINDLPQAVLDSNVSMYADDTSLCYQSHDMTRLNEAINSDLAKLDTWLQGNKLSLNVAKTHSMLISSKQKHNSILKGQNEDLKLKIRDKRLEIVKKTKYLGLQIDCSLDWKEQIKAVLPRSPG